MLSCENNSEKYFSEKLFTKKEVYMFIGRQQEIKELNEFLSSEKTKAALIYGKRRIGKTTLIQHVLSDEEKDNIFFEASEDTYESNLSSFTHLLSTSLQVVLIPSRSHTIHHQFSSSELSWMLFYIFLLTCLYLHLIVHIALRQI